MKKLLSFSLRLVLVSLLALSGLSLSQTEEALQLEVERAEQQLQERREERERIERELQATGQELERRLAELETIAAQLARLREQRRELEEAVVSLERAVAATLLHIGEEQAALEDLTGRVERLMLNLYYGRPNRNLRVLVKAESLFDLRVSSYYLSLMTEQDAALIREVEAALRRLADEQQQLAAERGELSRRESELSANEQALAAVQAQVQRAVAALEATREGQLALRLDALGQEEVVAASLARSQTALVNERARLERERQEALQREEEARRREEEAQAETQAAAQAVEDRRRARVEVVEAEQALQRLDLPVQQANAEFILPVSNASIASRYNESGPFIALRTNEDGAPVRAAIAGLVIEAALISANGGYLVTIQYAQQRCTVYTNLQPPRVAVGDHVSQGEIIGYLGGGALIRPDVLRFYVTTGSPCTTYTDPAPLLGIQ